MRQNIVRATLDDVLLFDGECDFCRWTVRRFRALTRGRIPISPFQEQGVLFQAMHYKGADGKVRKGAAAVYCALADGGATRIPWAMYRRWRVFAVLSEKGYAWVAAHRSFLGRWVDRLWGGTGEPDSRRALRGLLLRGMGLVYLVAFASIGVQLRGLVGENGVIAHRVVSDVTMMALVWAGALCSVLLLSGFLPRIAVFLAWGFWGGMVWLLGGFATPWDGLLFEAGFWVCLWAPRGPSLLAVWGLRIFLARLLWGAAWAKWVGGDPAWWSGEAAGWIWEGQALPTPVTAWFLGLGPGVSKFATASVLLIEGSAPLMLFGPRNQRILAGYLVIALQGFAMLLGGFGHFPALVALVAFAACFDDRLLRAWVPKILRKKMPRWPRDWKIPLPPLWFQRARMLAWVGLAVGAGFAFELPGARSLGRKAIISEYARAPRGHQALVFEGSDDQRAWKEYQQPPIPRWTAPHSPRLELAVARAARGTYLENRWVSEIALRLLEGKPEVAGLFVENPFPARPPRYARVRIERWRLMSGGSWEKRKMGDYLSVLSLAPR